jgi:lipopolysaccharide transport system permease protein
VLWVILQPLVMAVILTLTFRRVLGNYVTEMDYTLFVLSGIILWNFFAASITTVGTSMITNAPIIKKIYFPRLIIPCAGVLVSLVDFLVSLVMFIIFAVIKSPETDFFLLILCLH